VGGGEGDIIGVFDHAINIVLPRGLVCLVAEEVGRGPLNITVNLPVGIPSMSSLGLQIGGKVRVSSFSLELGGRHRVSFGSVGIYSPKGKLARDLLEGDEIAANLKIVRKTAIRFGNMQGLGDLLALVRPRADGAKAGNLNIFASAALPRLVRLEEAFFSEDESSLIEAVGGLVGLGPGLTPSSDDVLAGLVLVCALYGNKLGIAQRASQLVARATVAEARGKTTLLSEECLMQAALGRGNEPALRLCDALLTGGRESVERETRRVLAIGETSGTDTVLGIVLGTTLCMGRRSGLAGRAST